MLNVCLGDVINILFSKDPSTIILLVFFFSFCLPVAFWADFYMVCSVSISKEREILFCIFKIIIILKYFVCVCYSEKYLIKKSVKYIYFTTCL